MVGPVSLDQDLRNLPYIPQEGEFEERALTRYPPERAKDSSRIGTSGLSYVQQLLKNILRPAPTIPPHY